MNRRGGGAARVKEPARRKRHQNQNGNDKALRKKNIRRKKRAGLLKEILVAAENLAVWKALVQRMVGNAINHTTP